MNSRMAKYQKALACSISINTEYIGSSPGLHMEYKKCVRAGFAGYTI